ncbi:Transcriptional regulator [Frankia sp. AiPs1]|uniref:hypothetical protein n=1 Tax=Frankia sp. AiPa1 TaxID=573492 RepID=UPI00202B9ACD|nr:hypothetical protein [Frankia sp. AiPa1]MCL9759249.1 hypothetical protein [Frankia sp. AiPa1]
MARPRSTPIRNQQLATHIRATGLTYDSIAAAINRVSLEDGTALRTTGASLAKWLNGVTPQATTIATAVEAFSRLLNRPFRPADLGWPETAAIRPDNPWDGDAVAWIVQLGSDDMLDRRSALTAGVYSLAAAASGAAPPTIAINQGPTLGAGQADVARIRHMTRFFADLDDLHGGGHARTSVAAYLARDVAPLLHRTTGRARPDLFGAAAELAYLAGWKAADDGAAGRAQRYYVQALRMADEAGDPLLRASVLRSMAVQALELGHANTGLALAQAATRSIPRNAPLITRAWITGLAAEATAAAHGAPRHAHDLLRDTETYLDRADPPSDTHLIGRYHRPAFDHQIGLTLQQLGDLPGAENHLAASFGARASGERRSRALIGTRLADVQLRRRRPDAAAHTVLALTDDLTTVSSTRVHHTLTSIRTHWRPYLSDPTVAAADKLIATVTTL